MAETKRVRAAYSQGSVETALLTQDDEGGAARDETSQAAHDRLLEKRLETHEARDAVNASEPGE